MKEKFDYVLAVFEAELKNGLSVTSALIKAFDDMADIYELKPKAAST